MALALVPFRTAAQLEEEARAESERSQSRPVIQSLASHVRDRWEEAKDAKRDIEERMVDNLMRRRGQYDKQKLAEIKQFGGSEIFMGITSVKCRAACSWLRDTLMGTGLDRPWQLEHTPEPELPPEVTQGLQMSLMQQAYQQTMATGVAPEPGALRQLAEQMKETVRMQTREEAKLRVERMSQKIEDQLLEGGWGQAFSQFIDDIVTFPTAVVKGPVMRNRKQLKWTNYELTPADVVGPEWERVDPFMLYPAPWASSVNEGYLIERHRLTREALQAMLGVEGYDDAAIKTVLADFESGGLNEWLWIDTERADAEGKESDANDTDDLIDALQLWDSVQGKLLIEWGVPEAEIADPFMSYPCEVWLVGGTVIRAVLNYDPLGRKPYYATCYEKVPGSFWGNSVVDLVRDPQDMVNASARALANNMGVACLTADTVVYRHGQENNRKLAEITLGELWDRKHQRNSGLRRIKLRSLNEETGEFFGNRVVDILDNGVAEVFRVTTARGYTIKATATHRFMRDDGEWAELSEFDEGDVIAVNGQAASNFVSYDVIVSIEPLGSERVFDLCMTGPNHNFVANGFVSHNSGPQVEVNISRLPPGDDITQMYPWKIWQTEYHDFQDSSPAVRFFQPGSNAQELLGVLEKFATLADEYSGIPRYMTGEYVSGAGRTSSGLAMLINNAAKSLKHVVANIDADVITPMLERLYQHNLRYNADPDMLGDVRVVAKGAMSLVSREAAAVRRNEFLQVVLNSPVAQEIVGPLGAAELLRENAKLLDVNPDRLVPSREELQQRIAEQQQMQAIMTGMQAALPAPQKGATSGTKPAPTLPDGSRVGGRDSNNVSPRPNLK